MGDSNNGQASTSQANDLKTVTTSLQALTEQVGRLQTFMNYLMSDSEEQDTQPSSPIPSTSDITPPQNTTLESSDSEPVLIAGGSGATDNGESESGKEPTSLFRELLDKYDTKEKCGPALDTDLAELINTMMTHQQSPESIKTIHNKWLRPENTPHLVTPTVALGKIFPFLFDAIDFAFSFRVSVPAYRTFTGRGDFPSLTRSVERRL